MSANDYFGAYARYDTTEKREAALLLGADNIVGDRYSVEFESKNGIDTAWITNKFGKRIGYLDAESSMKLALCRARGWTITALLAFVAYTEEPKPGYYWGQVAVFAYAPAYEEQMQTFLAGISKLLGDGIRPKIDLGAGGFEKLQAANGAWTPTTREPMPQLEKGTAVVKSELKGTERLIEQARNNNPGCYAGTIVIFIVLIALVVFGLRSCGVFG